MRINFIHSIQTCKVVLTLTMLSMCLTAQAASQTDNGIPLDGPVALNINPDRAQAVPMTEANTAVAQINAEQNHIAQTKAQQQGSNFVTAAPDSHTGQFWQKKDDNSNATTGAEVATTSVVDPQTVAKLEGSFKALSEAQAKQTGAFSNVAFSVDKSNADSIDKDHSIDKTTGKTLTALAGTRWYATMAGGADSYVPGPVRVQLQEGPYAGAYALGSFQVAPDGTHLLLKFDTLATDTTTIALQAVAVDSQSEVSGLTGDIDHHFLRRFVIPGTVGFFQGAINLLKTGEQVSVNGFSTTVSSQPLSNTKLALLMGSTAADRLQENTRVQGVLKLPEVKIAPGTGLGFLLLKSI